MMSDGNATREQLGGLHGEDRLYYQALMLQEVFANSRVSQQMQLALEQFRGRRRPRP
jgi:hypothetical protein